MVLNGNQYKFKNNSLFSSNNLGHFVLCLFHQLGKLPHKFLERLSQLYGPIMSLNLGRIETITISSAETARALLKTHDFQSCNRPQMHAIKKLTYNFLDIAFTPYNNY